MLTSETLDNEAFPKFLITKCAKFLGVTLNDSLLFDLHINNVTKKLSWSVEILDKLKPYLNTRALLSLYYRQLAKKMP